MTRDTGDGAEWARFWEQAQQQAWDTWSRMARQALPQPPAQPDDLWRLWADGLERLWQGRATQLSGTSQEVFGRLLDQGKGFLFLSHQLLRAVEKMQSPSAADGDWKAALREAFDRVQAQLRQLSGQSVGLTALWGLPAEMWERLAAALSLSPGDWAQRMHDIAEATRSGEREGGEWPAWGVGREWQMRARRGLRETERYQEAWHCYATRLIDVGVLALDNLYERLVEAGETGQRIRRLRTVYDLWVDAAEQAYAEVVATPEFAAQQAELINAAVALKLQFQESLEATARANNQPTRRELDGAHHAIHGLRKELEALRAQLVAAQPPRRGAKGRKP